MISLLLCLTELLLYICEIYMSYASLNKPYLIMIHLQTIHVLGKL